MILLDSGCTKTVCGEQWLKFYIDILSDDCSSRIITEKSETLFKFGDTKVIKSNKRLKIPVIKAGVRVLLNTNVINHNIALLLSKEAMRNADTKTDFQHDTVHIFEKKTDIVFSSTGHYCIPINDDNANCPVLSTQIAFMCCNLQNKSEDEKFRIATKLHHQFAHPRSDKLKSLLKNAQISDKTLEKHLDSLDDTCDVCLKYKKPKARPVVGLPMATTFNETVAINLKHWLGNIWFLHLIDRSCHQVQFLMCNSYKEEREVGEKILSKLDNYLW